MADTPDVTICPDTSPRRDDLVSPFYALNYHFGMLLGVDDFATEQQYHHGKMRLHNAWLHGAGVVWGFKVLLDVEHGEIRVKPGLALDASGHELHLEGDACVNVVEWYLAHKDDEGFASATKETKTGVTVNAHVEICFKSCLTRQVPALLEPCEGGSGGTAYSRVFETVEIRLLPHKTDKPAAASYRPQRSPSSSPATPGKAPAPAAPPYHRLRVLFGLEEPILPSKPNLPTDQPVVDARNDVLKLPSEQRPAAFVQALRKLAALDAIDLQPAKSDDDATRLLFPARGDSPVVLADIDITFERTGGNGSLKLKGGAVDVTVRPSHIATATIQELLCGLLFRDVGTPSSGPRVRSETVQIKDSDISFQLDKDLNANSAKPDAFSVTTFTDADGWKDVAIKEAAFTSATASDPPSVKLDLKTPLASGTLVRLIARGTGPRPLLGTDLARPTPLAGAVGGPAPPPHDGLDFVFMQVRS